MAKKTKGGTTPKMETKVLNFPIPEDLHTSLKMKAAETKMTLKGYVIHLIEQATKGGKN
jgi:hypothetical protein